MTEGDEFARAWGSRLRAVGRALLDLLYPPRCVGCGSLGSMLCSECLLRIAPLPANACLRCGQPRSTPSLCAGCIATPSALNRIASTAAFQDPLRAAIHSFKYDNVRSLAEPLAALMVDFWRASSFSADLIVPVPLHRSRHAARGYNQSALLARHLAAAAGIAIDEALLVRRRPTRQQVGLDRAERAANVLDAFACTATAAGRHIVLIDDVCTTGATLEACGAALRSAGATHVWAFTLARPPYSA